MAAPRGIVTPEGVVLEFEEAGVGSRILAITLDLLVQFVVLMAFLFALGIASIDQSVPESVVVIVVVVAVFAVLFGYPVALETLTRGRTLGKMALGLRVVTAEGAPVQFRHAAIRAGLGLVDFYIVPGGVVAMTAVLLSRRGQRLGDLVAGTIVMRERQAGADAASYQFPPPQGYEGYVATLDVSNLGDERYAVVRSFLLRVWDLTPEARQATATRLATAVAGHLRHRPPPDVHPEWFLACVAAAYQARQRTQPAPAWGPPTG